jgi:hypothetical protein
MPPPSTIHPTSTNTLPNQQHQLQLQQQLQPQRQSQSQTSLWTTGNHTTNTDHQGSRKRLLFSRKQQVRDTLNMTLNSLYDGNGNGNGSASTLFRISSPNRFPRINLISDITRENS